MKCIRGVAFFLCCILCLGLPGCTGGKGLTPNEWMAEFCARYQDLPAGRVYRSGAAEWEDGYLPTELADALFREDTGENAFSLCLDCALFLSSSPAVGEVAYLRAGGGEDARRLAAMCAARIERVQRAWPDNTAAQNACVIRQGCDVILLMMQDSALAQKICRQLS